MEQVISECGGARVLVKSGPAKPKLEGLSKSQWSLANLAIYNKLVTEGELDKQSMLDYMSHTASVQVGHTCLPQKTVKRQQRSQSGTRDMGPRTSAGKVICKRFNSTAGCNLADCKSLHVCSVPSCEKPLHSTCHDQFT